MNSSGKSKMGQWLIKIGILLCFLGVVFFIYTRANRPPTLDQALVNEIQTVQHFFRNAKGVSVKAYASELGEGSVHIADTTEEIDELCDKLGIQWKNESVKVPQTLLAVDTTSDYEVALEKIAKLIDDKHERTIQGGSKSDSPYQNKCAAFEGYYRAPKKSSTPNRIVYRSYSEEQCSDMYKKAYLDSKNGILNVIRSWLAAILSKNTVRGVGVYRIDALSKDADRHMVILYEIQKIAHDYRITVMDSYWIRSDGIYFPIGSSKRENEQTKTYGYENAGLMLHENQIYEWTWRHKRSSPNFEQKTKEGSLLIYLTTIPADNLFYGCTIHLK